MSAEEVTHELHSKDGGLEEICLKAKVCDSHWAYHIRGRARRDSHCWARLCDRRESFTWVYLLTSYDRSSNRIYIIGRARLVALCRLGTAMILSTHCLKLQAGHPLHHQPKASKQVLSLQESSHLKDPR